MTKSTEFSEVYEMTDKQADTNRNDLIDLMIEKAKRVITNPEQLEELISEYLTLKH